MEKDDDLLTSDSSSRSSSSGSSDDAITDIVVCKQQPLCLRLPRRFMVLLQLAPLEGVIVPFVIVGSFEYRMDLS